MQLKAKINPKVWIALFSFLNILGCTENKEVDTKLTYLQNQVANLPEDNWRLIYEHDEMGQPISGSKDELLSLLRMGSEVRYGYRVGKEQHIEHYFPAAYITIVDEHVYAQNPPMTSQRWDHDSLKIWFGKQPFRFHALVSTDGNTDNMVVSIEGQKILSHTQARRAIKWFVK